MTKASENLNILKNYNEKIFNYAGNIILKTINEKEKLEFEIVDFSIKLSNMINNIDRFSFIELQKYLYPALLTVEDAIENLSNNFINFITELEKLNQTLMNSILTIKKTLAELKLNITLLSEEEKKKAKDMECEDNYVLAKKQLFIKENLLILCNNFDKNLDYFNKNLQKIKDKNQQIQPEFSQEIKINCKNIFNTVKTHYFNKQDLQKINNEDFYAIQDTINIISEKGTIIYSQTQQLNNFLSDILKDLEETKKISVLTKKLFDYCNREYEKTKKTVFILDSPNNE